MVGGVCSVRLILLLFSVWWVNVSFALNDRPIIGVLAQPADEAKSLGKSYIAASYVKYLESGGARVVPILYDVPLQQLDSLLQSINGVLLPGGGTDLNKEVQYYAALQYIYKKVLEFNNAGDYFVLWGTCQGFEQLVILTANDQNVLERFDAENYTVSLNFTSMAQSSRTYSGAPQSVMNSLSQLPITMNNHQFGISPTKFNAIKLNNFYQVLSTNVDRVGKVFVSTVEAIKYPIYGVQWHPEKNQFEWTPREVIQHRKEAVSTMAYHSEFLVNEARKSNHQFADKTIEAKTLIYNYNPYYVALNGSSFEQSYYFK